MPTPPNDNVRHAIELMTTWLENPDELSEMFIARLRAIVHLRPDDDVLAGAVELVMGMTELCGGLLITLAEQAGTNESEALRRLALAYAVE